MARNFALSILIGTVDGSTANIARINRAMDGLTSKATRASKQMVVVGKKMTTHLTLPIVAAGAAAARTFSSFEDGMANIATLAPELDIKKIGDEVLKLGRVIPVTLTNLQLGLKDVISGTDDASKAMGTLREAGMLGVSALGSTKEAVQLLVPAMNNFGVSAEKAAEIFFRANKAGITNVKELAQGFGRVAPVVKAFGIGIDDYAASVAAMTTAGVKAADVNTVLREILLGVGATGSKKFKLLIKESGGLGNALRKIKQELGGEVDALKKFVGSGNAAIGIISLAGAQNKKYTETLKGMRSGIRLMPAAFAVKAKTLKASGQFTKNALAGVAISIGKLLSPALIEASKEIQSLTDEFESLTPSTQKWIVKTVVLVAALGPLIFIVGKLALVFKVLAGAILLVANVFSILRSLIILSPIGALVAAIAVSALLIIKFWSPIKGFFKGLWDGVTAIFSTFIDFVSPIFKPVVDLIMAAWAPLAKFFKLLWGGVTTVIEKAWAIIKAIIDKIVGAVNAVVGAVKSVTSFLFGGGGGFAEQSAGVQRRQRAGREAERLDVLGLGPPITRAVPAGFGGAGAGQSKADVRVTFENMPAGARATADPKSTANLSIKTGHQLGGFGQ